MGVQGRMVAWLLVCSMAAAGLGCTSLKTIRPATSRDAPVFGNVKAGDTVVLHLHDGRRFQVTVQRIDGDAIVSAEGVRYTAGEIAQLQRRSFSGGKTALAVAGTVAGAYVVAGILFVIAMDSLW